MRLRAVISAVGVPFAMIVIKPINKKRLIDSFLV